MFRQPPRCELRDLLDLPIDLIDGEMTSGMAAGRYAGFLLARLSRVAFSKHVDAEKPRFNHRSDHHVFEARGDSEQAVLRLRGMRATTCRSGNTGTSRLS